MSVITCRRATTILLVKSKPNNYSIITQFLRSYSVDEQQRRRRVVVTGLGVISPVGCNVPTAWKNIIAGACGIEKLTDDAYAALPCRIAAQIPAKDLKLEDHFSKSEMRAMAPATAYGLLAGKYLTFFAYFH